MVLCLSRRVEWITRVEQFRVLGFWCATGGSLQNVLSVLRRNSVLAFSEVTHAMKGLSRGRLIS